MADLKDRLEQERLRQREEAAKSSNEGMNIFDVTNALDKAKQLKQEYVDQPIDKILKLKQEYITDPAERARQAMIAQDKMMLERVGVDPELAQATAEKNQMLAESGGMSAGTVYKIPGGSKAVNPEILEKMRELAKGGQAVTETEKFAQDALKNIQMPKSNLEKAMEKISRPASQEGKYWQDVKPFEPKATESLEKAAALKKSEQLKALQSKDIASGMAKIKPDSVNEVASTVTDDQIKALNEKFKDIRATFTRKP
jgi:hypothetical protein